MPRVTVSVTVSVPYAVVLVVVVVPRLELVVTVLVVENDALGVPICDTPLRGFKTILGAIGVVS